MLTRAFECGLRERGLFGARFVRAALMRLNERSFEDFAKCASGILNKRPSDILPESAGTVIRLIEIPLTSKAHASLLDRLTVEDIVRLFPNEELWTAFITNESEPSQGNALEEMIDSPFAGGAAHVAFATFIHEALALARSLNLVNETPLRLRVDKDPERALAALSRTSLFRLALTLMRSGRPVSSMTIIETVLSDQPDAQPEERAFAATDIWTFVLAPTIARHAAHADEISSPAPAAIETTPPAAPPLAPPEPLEAARAPEPAKDASSETRHQKPAPPNASETAESLTQALASLKDRLHPPATEKPSPPRTQKASPRAMRTPDDRSSPGTARAIPPPPPRGTKPVPERLPSPPRPPETPDAANAIVRANVVEDTDEPSKSPVFRIPPPPPRRHTSDVSPLPTPERMRAMIIRALRNDLGLDLEDATEEDSLQSILSQALLEIDDEAWRRVVHDTPGEPRDYGDALCAAAALKHRDPTVIKTFRQMLASADTAPRTDQQTPAPQDGQPPAGETRRDSSPDIEVGASAYVTLPPPPPPKRPTSR